MLLAARDLSFAYPARREEPRAVLRRVSVSLAAGEVVGLLGPNGSGKSTLLRCLLGQLDADAGEVRWDDRPLADWRPRDLARRVAYLPQSPVWEPAQTVRDAVAMGRAPYWGAFGVESPRDAEVVAQVSADLELTDLLDRRLDELSGGQRQRVVLARCLAQEPAALLLDEPNTFLDLRHQIDLARLLRRLATEQNLGVLMASHDLNLAGAFADRLVLLDAGAVAAEGTPGEVLDPAVLEKVFDVAMERVVREGAAPAVLPVVWPPLPCTQGRGMG